MTSVWKLTVAFLFITSFGYGQQKLKLKAVLIEDYSWVEASSILKDTSIVVIPLGAESKEHGPHLLLQNDWLIANYFKHRIEHDQPVVIYPSINYHYYPAFLEYAGSTSIRLETAYSMIVDLCRVISAHGPKKFYILNTGVSTLVPLKIAKDILARQGILMTYTDILHVAGDIERKIKQETAGTHADEIETSMMLYIAPKTVDMKKAAKDIPANDGPGPLTLNPNNPNGKYSPTGIYGDATLASFVKGKLMVEEMVKGINAEINALRKATVPTADTKTDLNQFTGVYTLSDGVKVTITVENQTLLFEGKGPRKMSALQQTDFSFTLGERGRIVFFDEAGKISTFYLNWEGLDFLGRK